MYKFLSKYIVYCRDTYRFKILRRKNMSIYGTYQVSGTDGESQGSVTVSQDGLFTSFCYEYNAVPNAVCRLICSADGKNLSLGVPVPNGGKLVLIKKLSKLEFDSASITALGSFSLVPIVNKATIENNIPVSPPSAPLPDEKPVQNKSSDWQAEPDPGRHFTDDEIKNSLSGIDGALVSLADFSTLLALPYTPGSPFPLMSAFKFGRIAHIHGKSYIVFRIRGGQPY
jgi:hypothetical protein